MKVGKNKEWIEKPQGYRKKILLGDEINVPGAVFQIVEFPAGVEITPHHHRVQTEVFHVLEGEARLCIGGECVDAKKGMSFLCKPMENHSVGNKGDGVFRMIVVKWNEPKENDYFEAEE